MNPTSSNLPLKLETSIKTNKYFANKINSCEYIVLHHTGKGDDMTLVKYLALNAAQVSCHYVVTTGGTVYKIAEDRQCTWHAGQSSRDGKTSLNYYSIGIEIVSDGYTFTDAQRTSVRQLVSLLMNVHKLSHAAIIRHKDIAPGRKRDVGDNFRSSYFSSRQAYQESYKTSSSSFESIVEQARQIGIRNGTRPNDPATRKEVAAMIMNAISYLKKS